MLCWRAAGQYSESLLHAVALEPGHPQGIGSGIAVLDDWEPSLEEPSQHPALLHVAEA